MTYEDEARRAVKIEVDRRKLAHRANSDAEEALLAKQEQHEAAEKAKQAAEDSRARAELQRKKLEEEREARAKEAKGPDPSDPDYYDKLADRMTSDNSLYRTKAVNVLVNTDPASVSSAAAKKKIARAFKQLAEGDIAGDRRKAIKGLALWGGKFSVPILLKMLDGRNTAYEEEVLKALGDLKDPQAAPAMAARLGNVRFHQIAFNALNDMGSGAEDALLEVGPSNDATICISAITLLGNVGTAKSIAFLQRAQSTINPAVRTAARSAMQKINARKRQEKADGARSLPGTALESRL